MPAEIEVREKADDTTAGVGPPPDRLTKFSEWFLSGSLCLTATAASYAIVGILQLKRLSPLVLGFLLACIIATLLPPQLKSLSKIPACGKLLLRSGVALLGVQISVTAMGALGLHGTLMAIAIVVGTIAFSIIVGRWLGIDKNLALLIGIRTGICGASAIIAASEVLATRRGEAGYALVIITLMGTVGMVVLPILYPMSGLGEREYGLFVGASLHEVAQVVGAGFSISKIAGEAATLEKLIRVLLLAPTLIALSLILKPDGKGAGRRGEILPLYVGVFLALAALNSLGLIPVAASDIAKSATPPLLTAGLAAVGLQTRVSELASAGARPLILGVVASLFVMIAGFSLTWLLFV